MFLPGFLKTVGLDPVAAQKVSYDSEGMPVFSDMLDDNMIIKVSENISKPTGFLSTLDPDMRDMYMAGLADPKTRSRAMSDLSRMYIASKRGGDPTQKLSSIRYDKDGNPWGYNSVTGQFQPIGGGFKKPPPQPLAVMNNYGSPIPATDQQGNPVFIRPPKGPGDPIIMPGFTPPEKPTEAEAKTATFHQQMQSANNGHGIVVDGEHVKKRLHRNPQRLAALTEDEARN